MTARHYFRALLVLSTLLFSITVDLCKELFIEKSQINYQYTSLIPTEPTNMQPVEEPTLSRSVMNWQHIRMQMLLETSICLDKHAGCGTGSKHVIRI